MTNDETIRATKNLCLLFIFSAIISFLYVIIKGRFNGDFLGVAVTLPFWILLINLLFCIAPFWATFKIYEYFKRKPVGKTITISITFYTWFLIFIMVWNAVVTIIYGVGILGAPPYEAPGTIKVVIQIMNRFNYMYGVFIYILLVPKKDRTQILMIILLLGLAYLRAGLGVIMYLGMIYYLKYFVEIKAFVKKKMFILIPILLLLPAVITGLYTLRSNLRGQDAEQFSQDPLTGILAGRLSSFSDSAFILQEAPYFFLGSQQLDLFYFQKQALVVLSMNFLPDVRPETMLFKFYYEKSEDNVAYMAGTQGNLYISLMRSYMSLILNVLTIIIYIYITFYLFRKLRFNYANELAFILLLYVLMSGVSNEYAFIGFSVLVFIILFLMVNLIKQVSHSYLTSLTNRQLDSKIDL